MRTYSVQQQNYINARASYEQVEEQVLEVMKTSGIADLARSCRFEEHVRTALRASEAWDALSYSALIAWGRQEYKGVQKPC